MIPKIIHTCWFTKNEKQELPDAFKDCINSWKINCPGFRIKVWTLSDWPEYKNYEFANECVNAGIASYPYLQEFFKIWVLQTYGGFFIDPDVILTANLEDFCNEDAVFGKIDSERVTTKIIAGKKDSTIFTEIICKFFLKNWINKDHSLNIFNSEKDFGSAVNCMVDLSSEFFGKTSSFGITVYPKEYFGCCESHGGLYIQHPEKKSDPISMSIVMPIWNSERFLRECIDSILNQDLDNFELLCIDDGSTDSSAEIINSYNDDRVVYIKKEHSGIVDSLNLGIRRSLGTYIVRMDSDDVMLPGRLSHQYNYMELNKDVDILGSGFQWGNGKTIPEYFRNPEVYLSIDNFRHGNVIGHPATIFRRKSILKLPYWYENYFQGCEDLKLWHHALHHGLVMKTDPTPVIIYRQHNGQETNSDRFLKKSSILISQIRRLYHFREEPEEDVRLTCIIPFQNEGAEIERTVANIRATAGNQVKIMLINDQSDDEFDYKWVADNYGCQYFKNPRNYGVAGSRNFGVSKCTTDYFVLLDGHMRFYDDNWHKILIRGLDDNPKCLVTTNTIVFSYDTETKIYKNEDGSEGRHVFGSYGAVVNMDEPGWEFTGKWTNKKLKGVSEDDEIIPISCCMGAVYAMSREYWIRLGGLNGLVKYGLDEPLMSIKTWLAGGKVLIFKDWGVGHLYRGRSPYTIPLKSLDQNHLYLINLFCQNQEDIDRYEKNLKNRLGEDRFNKAMGEFNKQRKSLEKFKEYFFEKMAVRDLKWYSENINNNIIQD